MTNMSSSLCHSDSLYNRLFSILSNNTNASSCLTLYSSTEYRDVYHAGRYFYAYFTPIIIVVGILGNTLSLNVFLSRNLRSLSSSTYLAALSVSDLFIITSYVTVEWLRRGLTFLFPGTNVRFLDVNGMCELQLYISYVSRFMSSWLLVAFTVERYIGICFPLLRRNLCTTTSTRKIVSGIFLLSAIIVIYKPILSGIYKSDAGNVYCTGSPQHGFISFVFDSIFALLISFVPFVIIIVINILIMKKLLRQKRSKNCKRVMTEESTIRLEFTIILLALSICFIIFNIPYLVLWCRNFLTSKYVTTLNASASDVNLSYWQGLLYFVRTIFYINYCINFFLYLITGAYFRREVRVLFSYKTLRRSLDRNVKDEAAYACLRLI
ncbi:neurotensin receptor type 1-like [Mytilus californianus]|uniref:neurotensin receptor type 1-like n=1 Tax=Mytilus californianus TaxID=6549 RepID=UPI002247EC51|nr:neurotensin receptor type 1-like [Mytilus californianus]